MATASVLRQFLAVVKALIIAGKRLARETWQRLLRQATLLWKILRSRLYLHIGSQKSSTSTTGATKTKHPEPSERPSVPPTSHKTPFLEKPATSPTHDTPTTKLTTQTTASTTPTATTTNSDNENGNPNDTTEDVIPLDSTISCSLHPYPYLNHNTSRASLQEGLNAARYAHSIAVSSRHASRSSQNVVGSPDTQSIQEGYTFTVKTPDHPLSPTSTNRRQYSLSLPQLPGGSRPESRDGPGYDVELVMRRTASSSPAESMLDTAAPAGVVPSIHTSIHEPKLGNDSIFPIVPEYFQRYDRPKFIPAEHTELSIKALTRDYYEHPDPPGWVSIVHPEGLRYFYHEEKSVVTDADLYNPTIYGYLMRDIFIIEDFVQANHVRLPGKYTLAIDLTIKKSGSVYSDYYFADHEKRVIFFLDDLEAAANLPVWEDVKGVKSLAHVREYSDVQFTEPIDFETPLNPGHEMEAQYWYHGILYPNTVKLTDELVVGLRDIVLHYIGDVTTSQYSTSPYNLQDLNQMLSTINSLKKNVGYKSHGASSLFCRIMNVFARQRFNNWHGVPEARLYRDQSVHGSKIRHKTLLIKTLSPLLFSAPDVHLRGLEKMWVDGLMHGAVWQEAIKKLNEEWQEFILYATVLLNANVGFLAIESVDIESNPYRSPTQIGCYLSIVSSVGSIILGLLLMRQNRRQTHGTAEDVCAFLKRRSHPKLGLETLAILYSLPYALLLWGMVSFLAAFAWNCFDDSNLSTRMIMGTAWVALAVLVAWCVWMGWVDNPSTKAPVAEEDEGDTASEGGSVKPSVRSHAVRSHAGISRPGSALSGPMRLASRVSVISGVPTRPASRASAVSNVGAMGQQQKNGGGGSGNGASGGGVIQNLISPLWRWPAMLFTTRRQSYDSQRTVV